MMRKVAFSLLVASALCSAIPCLGLAASDQFATPLSDVQIQQLRREITPPGSISVPRARREARILPAITFGTPTAFGAQAGQMYIGVSGVHYLDNDSSAEDTDGSMSVGMGFGDAVSAVGLDAYVNVISLRDSFGDSGSFGARLHKTYNPGYDRVGIAVGYDNMLTWGDADDAENTVYAVVSKDFNLRPAGAPLPLSISLGVGSGTFREESDLKRSDSDNGANVFGSIGLSLTQQLSVGSSWTGSQLNVGFGLVPFENFPVALSVGMGDITEEFDSGASLMVNVGYCLNFE